MKPSNDPFQSHLNIKPLGPETNYYPTQPPLKPSPSPSPTIINTSHHTVIPSPPISHPKNWDTVSGQPNATYACGASEELRVGHGKSLSSHRTRGIQEPARKKPQSNSRSETLLMPTRQRGLGCACWHHRGRKIMIDVGLMALH
jgi:hypothetical protein